MIPKRALYLTAGAVVAAHAVALAIVLAVRCGAMS